MRDDVRRYRERLDNSNESVVAREARNREAKKGLREKTREINRLHDEVGRLGAELQSREDDAEELIRKTDEAIAELDGEKRAAEERAREVRPPRRPPARPPFPLPPPPTPRLTLAPRPPGVQVHRLEVELDAAESEKEGLQSEVAELQGELEEEAQQHDEMAREYESSINELKEAVRSRGQAIDQRDARISELESQLTALNEAAELVRLRDHVSDLQQKLAEKQAEVQAAKESAGDPKALGAATAAAVAKAESAAAEAQQEAERRAAKQLEAAQAAHEKQKVQLVEEKKKYKSLGEKFAQREDVIVELRARMNEYEVGVYGLREAVQEVERHKTVVAARDAEIKRLIQERNRREEQLEDLKEETKWLRSRLPAGAASEDAMMDLSKLRLKSQVEVEQLKAQVLQYEEEVGSLESERLKLKKELRVKALRRGERAAHLEMSVEKLQALEEMEAGLDDDPDFADDAVGAGRVRQRVVYVQQGGAAPPPQQVGSAAPPPPASAAASAAGMAANIDISTNFAQIKDVTVRLGRVPDTGRLTRTAP